MYNLKNDPSFNFSRTMSDDSLYNDAILRSHSARNRVDHRMPVEPEPKFISKFNGDYFRFRDRKGHFDWRTLATIDVDRIIREVFNLLQNDTTW